MLLVPWGEIQPSFGPPPTYNEVALSRLQSLVASARAHNLQVILRVPYIWSMNPGQEMPNIERMTALLFDDRVRAAFFDAIRTIDRRVVRPNSNVRFVFATWEDFYGVTMIPEQTAEGLRDRFSKRTHVGVTVRRSLRPCTVGRLTAHSESRSRTGMGLDGRSSLRTLTRASPR